MTANQLRYKELLETTRSNKTNERERERHNLATETETQRSNIASELNSRYSVDRNFALGHLNYLETARANRAREANQQYSNQTQRMQVQEQRRSNLANEAIATTNATTNIGNLLESIRTHTRNEDLGFINSQRQYDLGVANLQETERSHKRNEDIAFANLQHQQNVLTETRRHNTTVEGETKRHNLIGEMQKNVDLINDSNAIKFNTLSNVLRSTSGLIKIGGLS